MTITVLRGYQRKYIKFVYVTPARRCSRQSHCCYARTIIYERELRHFLPAVEKDQYK